MRTLLVLLACSAILCAEASTVVDAGEDGWIVVVASLVKQGKGERGGNLRGAL